MFIFVIASNITCTSNNICLADSVCADDIADAGTSFDDEEGRGDASTRLQINQEQHKVVPCFVIFFFSDLAF